MNSVEVIIRVGAAPTATDPRDAKADGQALPHKPITQEAQSYESSYHSGCGIEPVDVSLSVSNTGDNGASADLGSPSSGRATKEPTISNNLSDFQHSPEGKFSHEQLPGPHIIKIGCDDYYFEDADFSYYMDKYAFRSGKHVILIGGIVYGLDDADIADLKSQLSES